MKHNRNIAKGDVWKNNPTKGLWPHFNKKKDCLLFGKHRDTPMKDVPKDYINWLLTTDLPDDTVDFLLKAL